MVSSKRACSQDSQDVSPSKVLRGDWAEGIRLFVVPLGSATASRRQIWDREIAAAGGCLASSPWAATHMLLSPEVAPLRVGTWAAKLLEGRVESVPQESLSALRTFAESLQCQWVCTDWLIACLAKQCRVPEHTFTWSQNALGQLVIPKETGSPAADRAGHPLVDKSEPMTPTAVASSTRSLDARSPAPTQAESDDSEVEEVPPKLGVFGGEMTSRRAHLLRNRAKFACQRGPEDGGLTGGSSSPPKLHNQQLVAMFGRLQQHYESLGDGWRERSYRLTASILRSLPFEVISETDLDRPELRRLGKKTRDKLKEFLQTGSIGRVDGLHTDEFAKALGELQGIWGVGLTTARRWLGSGCRSVSDVRQRVDEGTLRLSADQMIGLQFFEEFSQRIPRSEVEEIIGVVKEAVSQRFGSRLRMEACGSFRRRKTSCGDVDLLLTARSAKDEPSLGSTHDVLSVLVTDLRGQGFITHDLKGGNHSHRQGQPANAEQDLNEGEEARSTSAATYFGVCKLAGSASLHRRIDIKVYPMLEFPFALLSFTGSGPFNRSMRLYARRAGFSLSDHSICRAAHARGNGRGERIWTGPPISAMQFVTEKDIFEFLGLAYREPWQREVDASWIAETGTDKQPGGGASSPSPTAKAEHEATGQQDVTEVQSLSDSDEPCFAATKAIAPM